METEENDDVDALFTLTPRTHAVPGDLRIMRRMGLLTLLLDACRDARASLEQLHVLNWAVRTQESREAFLSFLSGAIPPDQAVVRYDPSLSRALDFARYEELVQDRKEAEERAQGSQATSRSYRVALTSKGREVAAMLQDEDYLIDEKLFLESIGRKVTQKMVESLFAGR